MSAALAASVPYTGMPPSATAASSGFGEALNRAFAELHKAVEHNDSDRRPLLEYVENDARDLNGKPLMIFINDVYIKIESKIRSDSVVDRLVGIRAIDELMDSKVLGETAAKVSHFAKFLKEIFQNQTDRTTLEAAARVEGHVVKSGGPLAADVVDNEVKRALESLAQERLESRRYASLVVLQMMAENSPAIFNVHVRQFIDSIWFGLRDPKLYIREAAVVALRACLEVVEQRETRYRVQWYYRLFDETHRGLQRTSQIECVHGSLMALGELVQHTGEFMLARYREVVETVMRFRNSKERLIRTAVIMLLPRLASFAPERFASTYLQEATLHLVSVLKNPSERGAAFEALGETASTLARIQAVDGMEAHLPAVAAQIRDAIASKGGRFRNNCPAALSCVGILAEALGARWLPYAKQLLEPIVLTGLSDTLVASLRKVVRALPQLLPTVQALLLDTISIALFNKAFSAERPPAAVQLLAQAVAGGEHQGAALIKVSLRTLSAIDFDSVPLLPFVYSITEFLDYADPSVRKAAALACCQVLVRQLSCQQRSRAHSATLAPPRGALSLLVNGTSVPPGPTVTTPMISAADKRLTDKIAHKLLTAAVADTSVAVRLPILCALSRTTMLDQHLVQVESLQCLFVALNDEDVQVRSIAVQLTGRLSLTNPAHIMPALRRHLMQLLSDIEHSPDSKQREESALLLGILIKASPRLVLPYIAPILTALVGKLKGGPTGAQTTLAPGATGVQVIAGGGEDSVVAVVLTTLGELASVSGAALHPHLPEILPLIIEATQDSSSSQKRLTAVKTLGLVVESTGLVVVPYNEFPQLLGVLLRMLAVGAPPVRREVMKVLGVIGALDPHQHKLNQAALQGEGKLEAEGVRPQRPGKGHGGVAMGGAGADGAAERTYGDDAGDLLTTSGLVTSSDEYYPTVAINALMRVLKDPAAQSLHAKTVHSLFYIFQSMQVTCVPYLPKVMPVLFNVMRSAEDYLREFLCQQLTVLATYLRQHIRKYLPDILAIVHEFWVPSSHLLPYILKLVSELAIALRDDFRQYTPELLPKFIALFAEAERTSQYESVKPALQALEGLGTTLEDHLQLLLPVLMRLIGPGPTVGGEAVVMTPLAVRKAALHSTRQLLSRMQLAGYASAILHPLLRVLDGPAEELRCETLDTVLSLSVALGSDFVIFIPTIRKILKRRRLSDERFNRVASLLTSGPPPCMSEAEDWEGTSAWLEELLPPAVTTSLPCITDAHVIQRLPLNDNNLRRAWECSSRSTKEDWAEWMRHFSVELLKESPSPALRACHAIALAVPQMARELFAAGFVSCWSELEENAQEQLVRSLEAALASPSIPPEIVTTLLNLAEFMEHDEKALPLDTRTLGALAEKCHAFAKALHYKELEYHTNPAGTIEALISINNQLRQPDAAQGVLELAEREHRLHVSESWREKLGDWTEALQSYTATYQESPLGSRAHTDASLGRMRCLAALAEWEQLLAACRHAWAYVEPHIKREVAPMGAAAAWQMGQWGEMEVYVSALHHGDGGASSSNANFLSAVMAVRGGRYEHAQALLDKTRELLSTELAALVGESYERAYADMVRVQQVRELEEVIDRQLSLMRGDPDAEARWQLTREMWRGRLKGLQNNVEVWQALLSVRSLVVPMSDDHWTWLKFAALCRKTKRPRLAERVYRQLLQYDPLTVAKGQPGYGAGSGAPTVMYGYLKHLWVTESSHSLARKTEAYSRMVHLSAEVPVESSVAAMVKPPTPGLVNGTMARTASALPAGGSSLGVGGRDRYEPPLSGKVHLKLCEWLWYLAKQEADIDHVPLTREALEELLHHAKLSTEAAPRWAKAWHAWGKFNAGAMQEYCHPSAFRPDLAQPHVAPAIAGYFRSVSLSQTAAGDRRSSSNLQDILRLLTLWFAWGHTSPEVEAALQEGFGLVCIDTWLVVIPQIIARIHTQVEPVKRLIRMLLVRIGRHHPQALMYPLLVACKSQSPSRRAAAEVVMDEVRQQNATLVEQATLVSNELIRIAILWHELWHEALEEASRLYFGESNVEGMLSTLLPLHEMMDSKGACTLKEIAFEQAYGRELKEAYDWCLKYKVSRREAELHQAWDLYYHVFKRINKQLPTLTVLDLQYVSPALVKACGLELAVPGTYIVGEELVTIASFAPQLHVITSKQRPRKLTIHGSDGADYMFLLKGHEDLRQDERVMQLFGLVNGMLQADRDAAERDLSIARYAVIPLSPNSGLIGWVPNTDTLHALIREFRDARKIPLNMEHRMMLGMAPDYDHLMVIQKVEVFEHALEGTAGDDLHKVLWLKSRNSEVWLDRRTSYTRSLAVMSMVGYLLGLGDRHPSNIMLDRYSGKILHIDFGDCFEASMHRDKFPEKVPFRLTRMLIKAMEVAGVRGTFFAICKKTMDVLRREKESVMAMLEAFVHDPLINWRLLNAVDAPTTPTNATGGGLSPVPVQPATGGFVDTIGGEADTNAYQQAGLLDPGELTAINSPLRRETREQDVLPAKGMIGANAALESRAHSVIKRIEDKLNGTDFIDTDDAGGKPVKGDDTRKQVAKLIDAATSHTNLCQSYIGWCPFW